jgi:FkbM family methyltransferase
VNKLKQYIKKIWWGINFQYYFKLNGTRMKGLKIYQAKTSNVDEKWMGQILGVLLKLNNDAFLDVGVNIGQTLCQVKSIDFKREYFGFEPNPACNMFVEELIRINKFPNVKIFPVGIFPNDSILELDLYYDDLTNAGGSIIKDVWSYSNIKAHRTIIVPLMKYETITQRSPISKLGIVKIDVEGAELEALRALYKKIEEDRPIILMEVLSAFSYSNTAIINRQKQIVEILRELNYDFYRIIEFKAVGISEIHKIDFFDPQYDHCQANYIFIPVESTRVIEVLKRSFNFSEE